MKESSTYQATIAEGMAEGETKAAREILLRLGRKRFGAPTGELVSRIEGLTSVERLEELAERLLDVESWDELIREE